VIARQLDPFGPEGALECVEAVHRLLGLRDAAGTGHVHTGEVHLVEPLGQGDLDSPPEDEVYDAGVGTTGLDAVT